VNIIALTCLASSGAAAFPFFYLLHQRGQAAQQACSLHGIVPGWPRWHATSHLDREIGPCVPIGFRFGIFSGQETPRYDPQLSSEGRLEAATIRNGTRFIA